MPFPNEHACRIRQPGLFESGSFRRIKQGKLSILIARLKGQTTTTTQAFRYPIVDWMTNEARKHCAKNKGRFEKATNAKD